MRRYHITIEGRSFAIDVDDVGSERWRVVVDGREFDVALDGAEEIAVVPAAARPAGALAAPPGAKPDTLPAARPVAPPRPLPGASVAAGAAASAGGTTAAGNGGADTLAAPMPGVVLRIVVAPGAVVKRGQDIAVLEAMKMENILRSPRDGRIAEVCVQAGQQVAHGQAIVRFEARGSQPGAGGTAP